jgi:hypothetical protein
METTSGACMHLFRPDFRSLWGAASLLMLVAATLLVPAASHDVGVLMFLHDAFESPPVLSSWAWDKEPCQPPWFGIKECNQTSGCHTIGDASEDEQNCR